MISARMLKAAFSLFVFSLVLPSTVSAQCASEKKAMDNARARAQASARSSRRGGSAQACQDWYERQLSILKQSKRNYERSDGKYGSETCYDKWVDNPQRADSWCPPRIKEGDSAGPSAADRAYSRAAQAYRDCANGGKSKTKTRSGDVKIGRSIRSLAPQPDPEPEPEPEPVDISG